MQTHLEQLACSLVQWISLALVTLEGNEDISTLSDVLCTSSFSFLGLVLPTLPSSHHRVCLQFICRALLHASPKAVSCEEA